MINRRRREERELRETCRAKAALCLTYDDGPGRATTPALLDLLAERSARATFFLLGLRAQAAPEIAERIVAEGHEAACHTHEHLNAWKIAPARASADVRRGYESLERWLPKRPLFRPPYGKITPWTRAAARRRGSRVAWWTVDSGDTRRTLPSVEEAVRMVEEARGGVVLMHDFDREGDNAKERRDFVLDATARMLEIAERQGLRIMTMSELMNERAGVAA